MLKKKKNINLSRKKAEELIKGVIERAKQINASPDCEFIHRVTKIAVFGSYLTGKDKLGDIDIAVEIEGRWVGIPGMDGIKLRKMKDIICENDGKVFSWDVAQQNYPYNKVFLTLKKRSTGISLHDYLEIKLNDFPHKIVYDYNSEIMSNKNK